MVDDASLCHIVRQSYVGNVDRADDHFGPLIEHLIIREPTDVMLGHRL